MKKITALSACLILSFCLVFLGCDEDEPVQQPVQNEESLLQEYLNNLSSYEAPVREYGKPVSHIHMDEQLSAAILYPQTDIEFLDNMISIWINDVATKYINETKEYPEDTSELFMSYNSYLTGSSIVSIKMEGSYFSTYMAHPVDITKTFNVDISKGELLDINDVIGEEYLQGFKNHVIAKSGADKEYADEHFLDNVVITKDGIEIILNRGDYLPMSEGTKVISFSYGEISGIIDLSFGYSIGILTPPEDDVTAENQGTEENTENADETGENTTNTESEEAVPATAVITIDPEKPMIALTFDDGPSAHTDRLLNIFNQYGVKGTFFVLGDLIDGRESTLLRISEEGHEIGNHSWNHRQFTNLTQDEIKDQIMMTRAKIFDVTGKDCLIVRPPYGAYNDDVKQVGQEVGVSFINWSVDTLDWQSKGAKAVHDEVVKYARDGSIVLCHDLHKTTVDAMETVIPMLIEEGYQLVTVSQILEYEKSELEAGKLYYMRG